MTQQSTPLIVSKRQHLVEGIRETENYWSHCGEAQEAAIFTQVVHSLLQKLMKSDVCLIWVRWQLTQTITVDNNRLFLYTACAQYL